jgi:gliding motility-associated-like protein
MPLRRTFFMEWQPSIGLAHMVVSVLAVLLTTGVVNGQAYSIFNGTTNACAGAFLDSGGQGASGYGNDENYTYTICPDVPGGAISLSFLTFNLSTAGAAPIDFMTIYDGNSAAAPQLVNWTGTAGQGQVVSASGGNPTGCLTIVFRSNNSGTGVFAATITCYQPCSRPTAAATHGATNPQRICPGESVTFNSSASTAAAGNSIANRRWDFGDGTILNNAPANVNHTYSQPGGYMAQLTVFDNNGCASTNQVDLLVLVGTEPTFNGTGGTLTGCVGETLCLNGAVQGTTWTETPNPNLGGGVFLPDIVGECFESTITYDQFPPGATLTNVNGLLSICMDMEHSFIGDLIINIISPTGQTVTMHQQGGGATFLGVPVDNDLTPNAQGTCWNYCWSPTATNGTWADNATGTLPAGTYESLNPLSGLVGSQLNGTWTIQVCDMWASDNGFICNWNIDFNPSLFDDLIEFTPTYGAQCDSSYWTGPNITSQTANCNQACVTPPAPGNYNYVYHVTDNFGCTYDTSLTVTIIPGPQVNAGPDASTCNTPVQLGATIAGGGFPTTCTYTLTLYDSFGDGWTGLFGGSNGSSVTITVNGTPSSWTLPNGSQGSTTITVATGSTIQLSYTPGSLYNGEQSYTLFNSTGGVVYASPTGPGGGVSWSGVANCPGGGFVYSWTPSTGLSDPNIANPTANVSGTTQYCVTVYQVGHPSCMSTDCMTITVDNQVDPGVNATVAACSNGAAITLFTQLGGTPTAGGTWTAPGGGAHSGSFQPGIDAPGIYTYTVGGAGACGTPQSSTVNVTVYPLPNAGTSSSMAVCSTDAVQSMIALLGGTAQPGGTWSGPSPVVGGNYDPATMNPGVYTYTVNGTAPCPNSTATVTVTESTPPNAGNDASITLCNTSAPVVLVTQLGGSPSGTGTWTAPGGGTVSGGLDPAVDPPGPYTYTVAGTAPCPNDVVALTVAINQAPTAGTNGAITLCSSGTPVSLFTQLGGTPDVGGTWSGPSPVVGGMIDPATMSAGVYTYTVNGVAPCPSESATVTVTINTPPVPGTPGAITLCSSDAPASLFAQLGGTPNAGGTWIGPSPVVGDMLDPATMSAGVYTYTLNGVAPCPSESATVTVTINTPPVPGTPGAITLCSSVAPASLFTQLGGTPDAGGTWSGPSPVVGGMIDPATMSAGAYIYTVNGVAPCPSESATVTVTINTPPVPGTPGAITLCSSDAPASLFAQLGGSPDAGGTWSGPSPVVGGMIDPATMSAGAYIYTVNGVAPCPSESSTVTVTINTPPVPGTPGAITLCSSDAPASLFAQVGGTPDAGGTWSGPSPVVGGMIDPATMSAGVYTYTVAGLAPCVSASSTVTVTINTPSNAGSNGALTLCTTSGAASLFNQLGGTPQVGGTWSGPSAVIGGMIDPATMNAGNYIYTVAGTAPCPDVAATVAITINTLPNAGIDGGLTLCSSSPVTTLLNGLNGTPDPGGNWTEPGGSASNGTFTPGISATGIYTYTVNGTAPCPAVSATVDVNVVTNPNAGLPGSVTLCATDAATLLFAQLGGTPDAGGTWSGPSAVVGGLYDPTTMNPGIYTYTITVPPPCVNASSTVTITEIAPPNAGTDGALTLCISSPATSLFAQLGGGGQAGGTWSGPSPVVAGMFNPATMTAGVYTYTVNGTTPCPNDQSTVTVNVVAAPNAGTPGNATLCATDDALNLFAQLGGTPDAGGTWSGPSAVVGGLYDPATMNPGVYTYTITVPPPCVNASSTVTITEIAPPNAGTDGALTLCISSPATSLFAQLGGGAQAGGTWSGLSPVVGGMFNPANMTAGVYTYTVNGTTPCPNDQSTVTVNVVAAPNAGTPGNATLCATDADIDLYAELGGTPDLGGAWSGPSPVLGGQYDPATMNPGVYTYTITVPPPCVNASSTVTITEIAPPNAGTDGALTLCISSPATSLFAQLGGGAQAGGTWIGPSAVVGDMFNPANMTAGVYTYTVNGTTPCPNDQSTVTVNVVAAPNAGTPGNATLCATDADIDLYAELGGTPDLGGAWGGPSPVLGGQYDPATMNPGVYTYTITVPPPCVNASSTVTITEIAPPNAGTDGAITLCISSPATSLFAQLGGGAQAGGTWIGPSAVVGDMFNPANMTAGVYTYTVNGTTPCPNDQSTVTVNVVSAPDPGGPGFLTICSSDAPDDLFGYIEGTPDQGGQWTTPSGSVFTGMFDPASMTSGVYTYTIAVPPPCVSVSSTVTVDVITAPNAGMDGAATLCLTGAPLDLFATLGGSPDVGGTWTTSSGAPFSSTFDPAVHTPGVYNYTVNGTAPCPADVASVTIAVTQLPNAGNNAIVNLCVVGDAVDLFNALGGADSGGTWNGPAGASTGLFTPGSSIAGVYIYTVAGQPPCPSASATVTVNVLSNADAGGDGGTTLCGSDDAITLFNLLQGSPDAGGTWFGPGGATMNGTFNPSSSEPGVYTYILYVPAPCQNDTAQMVMSVVAPVNAGSDGSATLCSNDTPIALFNLLNGTPDLGGSWTAPNGGPSEGSFAPGVDQTGGYVYTVYATAPCTDQSATVTLGVNPLPDAGTNGSTTLCPEAAPISLFALLGGSPMPGGTWTGPNGQPSNGVFDPASSPQGAYTYTDTGLAPCPNAVASSTATVYLIAPPNAGPDAVSCTLEFTLNATGNWASGTWSGPAGITFGNSTSPTSSVTATSGGAYTLTWSVTSNDGCATQDQVTITFTDAIVPLVATTDAICNGACNGTANVEATGGNGAYSYAWSNGIAGNTPTATGICAGTYTVTVLDVNNCSATAPFTIGEPVALDIDAIAAVNETCPGSCDGTITIADPQGAQYSITGGNSYQTGTLFGDLCPGEYAIVMMDANGCTATGIATIGTPPPVIAYFTFSPDSLLASDPEAQFNNLSSPNATAFTWDFAGLGSSTATSPTYTFPGTLGGVYTVCLTATDANGCPDTYCAPVQVFDALLVHVANVFTPNDDGINEGFAPVFNMTWAVGDYEFLIFNRWGELLYETHVVDEKWNGIHGGGTVETEVFVWKLRCRDRLTRQWIERIGHVTVLK